MDRTAPITLRGRARECAALDDLVASIVQGTSRSLVLRGEAGMGKTALLGHLTAAAAEFTVLRATGAEWEMELAYAGLHQLCGPLLGRLDSLPGPQCQALATVFGLSGGDPPDRFLVGLAVLSLLASAADERPLLCVVDDAQWLDRATAVTLAFVARRLLADPVGMVFAARDPGDALRGLPQLDVRGVHNGDARALLGSAVRFRMDERVRDRIIAETRGNPLALLELPRALSTAELAGGFGLPTASTVPGRIEESFVRRLAVFPDATRLLLLLAAAEPVGDPLLLWRACELLHIAPEAAAPAQADELITIGERVTFRHPLVRSAVYRSASLDDRRAIHLALAGATDGETEPDRQAWHRAAATAGPDEEVAEALERSAGRAQARGGLAAAAAFRQRAVVLTKEPERRADRALAAADTCIQAGAFDTALSLVASAETGLLGDFQRARADLLRGHVAFAAGDWREAPALLLKAARELQAFDLDLARETYLTAWGAAGLSEDVAARAVLLDICNAVRQLPPPRAERPIDLLLDGLAQLITDGHAVAVPTLRRAVAAVADLPLGDILRWGWMAVGACSAIWDYESWNAIGTRQVRVLREHGAMAALPVHLTYLGMAANWVGDFAAAASLIGEIDSVAAATGSRFPPYTLLRLRALQGREEEVNKAIADVVVHHGGEGTTAARAHWAASVLYNGLGRYEKATSAARRAVDGALNHWMLMWVLPDLIEAAVRSGEPGTAQEAFDRLASTTQPCGTDFALGIEARCRALLLEGGPADSYYREAIERFSRTPLRPELARSHLLYGEWLRREKRRTAARHHLRTAFEMLGEIGMEAFAERARSELEATGEKVRRRTVTTRDDLTAQERQIARLARDGLSNAAIGARLFLSQRTIEWHLHNIFTKLDIKSRRELPDALADSPYDVLLA